MLKNASSADELQSVHASMEDILGPITAKVRSAAAAIDYDKLVDLMRSQAMLVAGDTRYVDPVHVLRPTSLLGASARKELPG